MCLLSDPALKALHPFYLLIIYLLIMEIIYIQIQIFQKQHLEKV